MLDVSSLIFLFAVSTAGSTFSAVPFDEVEALSKTEVFVEETLFFGGGDRVFNTDLKVNLGLGANVLRVSCSFADNALTAYTTTNSALFLSHSIIKPNEEY